jgi:hypothetical protein
MGASLDQLGVPPEFRERAKIMWIITLLGGLWGWIICAFVWKLPGQEQNQWFQFQLKQNLYLGVIMLVLSWTGIGWFAGMVIALLGFMAINKGEDFEAPVIGGMARK